MEGHTAMPPRRTLARTNPDFRGTQGAPPRTDIDATDATPVVLHNTETGGTVVMRRSALRSLGDGWVEVREVGSDTKRGALDAARAELAPEENAGETPAETPDAAAAGDKSTTTQEG